MRAGPSGALSSTAKTGSTTTSTGWSTATTRSASLTPPAHPSHSKRTAPTAWTTTAIGGWTAATATASRPGLRDDEEDCFNGEDDNGDGLVDCGDPLCEDVPPCPFLFEICGNGADDDNDARVDCDDPDCFDAPICAGDVERCDNGVDDDDDGLADCDDPDCEGTPECRLVGDGECLNPDDEDALDDIDLLDVGFDCALPCFGVPDQYFCIRDCVLGTTDLSDDCAGCMAGAVGCLTDECLLDCLGGPDSAGCIACAEEACGDDFETCSGLPLPI